MRGMNTSQMGRTLIELRFGFPRHQATYRIPLAVPDQSTAYLHDLLTDESHLETLDAIRSAYYSLQNSSLIKWLLCTLPICYHLANLAKDRRCLRDTRVLGMCDRDLSAWHGVSSLRFLRLAKLRHSVRFGSVRSTSSVSQF